MYHDHPNWIAILKYIYNKRFINFCGTSNDYNLIEVQPQGNCTHNTIIKLSQLIFYLQLNLCIQLNTLIAEIKDFLC